MYKIFTFFNGIYPSLLYHIRKICTKSHGTTVERPGRPSEPGLSGYGYSSGVLSLGAPAISYELRPFFYAPLSLCMVADTISYVLV